MSRFNALGALSLVLLLAGCGGGGGGNNSVATNLTGSPVQGIAQGPTNMGTDMTAIILETGEFYNITSAGGLALLVDQGTLSSLSYAYSGTATEYTVATNATQTNGIISGQFIPQSAITGTTVYNVYNVNLTQYTTFSATYLATDMTPASLAALAGSYVAPYYFGGPSVTMTISSGGSITGTNGSCTISGTATPRASGINVFNVSLTLGGTGCVPAGVGSASGVAALVTSSSGANRLYVATLNGAASAGFFWIGDRQ